jgi:hypothetical protein
MAERSDIHKSSIFNSSAVFCHDFKNKAISIGPSLLLVAKVFAQSVDTTPSGFGSQPWLLSFKIIPDLK